MCPKEKYKELDYVHSIVKAVHYNIFNASGTVNYLVDNISAQLATTIKNEDFIIRDVLGEDNKTIKIAL